MEHMRPNLEKGVSSEQGYHDLALTVNNDNDFFNVPRFNRPMKSLDLPKGEKITKYLGEVEISYFSTCILRDESEVGVDFIISLKNKGNEEVVINFPDVNELKENVPVCSQNHITHFFAFQVPPIKIIPGGEKKLWYLVPREKDDCNFTLPFRLWKNNDKLNYIELPVEFGYSNEDFRGIETSMIYGYVKDENGNPISNPDVKVHMNCGRMDYSSTSDEEGRYFISLLGMEDINSIYGQRELACDSKDYFLYLEKEGYEFYFKDHLAPTRKNPLYFNITLKKRNDNISYSLDWERQVDEPYGFFWVAPSEDWKTFAAAQGTHAPLLNNPYPTNIYLFDSKGNILWKYPVKDQCWGFDITHDGSLVAAGCHDKNVYVINAQDGSLNWKAECGNSNREVEFSHDGKYLITGPVIGPRGPTDVYDVGIYNSNTGKILNLISGDKQWLRNSKFSLNDSIFVVGESFGYLEMYDLKGNKLWENFNYIGEFPMFLAIDRQNNVYAGGKTHTLFSFDSKGNLRWKHRLPGTITYGGISEDGSRIAVSDSGRIYLFDENGTLLWKRPHFGREDGAGHNAVTISSDGKYVVIGTVTNNIIVYNEQGTIIWKGHSAIHKQSPELLEGVTNVQISKDNNHIIAVYGDNFIREFIRN